MFENFVIALAKNQHNLTIKYSYLAICTLANQKMTIGENQILLVHVLPLRFGKRDERQTNMIIIKLHLL